MTAMKRVFLLESLSHRPLARRAGTRTANVRFGLRRPRHSDPPQREGKDTYRNVRN